MKLFIITYSTNEKNGSFAIKSKSGKNCWSYEDVASRVLKETFDAEVEGNGEVFDAQCCDTNARIEYEDGSWAEYRVVGITIPLLHEIEINQQMEDYIQEELTEKEASKIRGFIENAYFHDESCLPLEDYAKVINSKLKKGETVEIICSQNKWAFLEEVSNFSDEDEDGDEDF